MRLVFTFVAMAVMAISTTATAQISIPERFVQIRSIDFTTSVIELHNFGEVNQSLNGWRFCSHDENQFQIYTSASGLNGMSIGPFQSLFIHFNNDANPLISNQINRSAIAGSFALPLDTDGAYAIQIYWQTPFGTGGNIADHIQMSLSGNDNLSADARSDEAEAGGVWVDQNEWVNVESDTERVELLETSSGNEFHSPADYEVFNPLVVIGDVNCDGLVNLLDIGPFVQAVSSGNFDPKADVNQDGLVNLTDIAPFVALLSGN